MVGWKVHIIYFTLGLFLVVSCDQDSESYSPVKMDITEAVYSSVTMQPDSLYDVFASVNGIVQSVEVSEGDSIRAGEVLIRISNTVPKLNAQNAKFSLEQARRNAGDNSNILNGILEELHSAELKLTNDSLNYERQKKLWDNGIGSKVNLESKRLAYLSTRNQVDMIKSRLERTRYDLRTQLNQAVNLFQSATSNSSDFNVVSRIDGKVYRISKNQGETVTPQMPLASVGSVNSYILEMLIDEVDITKVELGQKILLTLDAYGKEVFEARVNKIYPAKDMRTQTFLVEGTFEHMPNKLYPGLTGEANIVIRTKENATVVLNQFVSEKSQVNTIDGLVDVVQGIKSLEYTEIISGVDTSTQILPLDQ